MATQADVRRIALALPATRVANNDFGGFEVLHPNGKAKGLAWHWRERVDPKKPKVLNQGVIVVPVRDLEEKAMLVAGDPDVFFTEPHYDGWAMVLVRLSAIRVPALRKILGDAWRCVAPKSLVDAPPVAKSKRTKSKSTPTRSTRTKSKRR